MARVTAVRVCSTLLAAATTDLSRAIDPIRYLYPPTHRSVGQSMSGRIAVTGGELLTCLGPSQERYFIIVQICLNAGMNDYLGKPIKFDQLLQKLAHWSLTLSNTVLA